ncbi:uncharacterized protein N7518_002614 [Penicillium psychrosexuale]|uniref:uncharacterized protein n=1 Tax=Penicillium psychrosexuale TaxID=1002107 RepID=UPI0025454283|nr:uncharacterized protein N7518_002614 [Penicillium psychrosexuale]KAJ5800546.1 hypothetical protein N7518_002614 [Penicillium psychrosexuale]
MSASNCIYLSEDVNIALHRNHILSTGISLVIIRWDYKKGAIYSISPYRARFLDDIPDLASVPCIEKLSFPNHDPSWDQHHQIWTGAVQTILQFCPTITDLELNLDEWVRPDHLEYIQARRAALSSLLGSLPRSLRVLDYEGESDGPWKPSMPALNLIPSGIDGVSLNLRDLSVHLQELKLKRTSILRPAELGFLHLNWPYLKILEIEFVPAWLPSGEWTYHNTPEDQAEIDNIEDWEDEICDVEAGWKYPKLRTEEHFHRLLISLGYAARRMPRLKDMKFEVESQDEFMLHFRNCDEITLELETRSRYQPANRVAKAWNFAMDDVRFPNDYDFFVILPSWPPAAPI